MTIRETRNTDDPPADTHEMVVVHRAFRRESQVLISRIAAVPEDDRRRTGTLAAHLRWYEGGLSNHHHGEDELIWPLLHRRADVQADVVVRMEAQHEHIAETLGRAMAALPAWQESADASARDKLVLALTEHRATLIEHLDDEECHLLPLARRYLTRDEWSTLGEHFVSTTPKSQLLVFLGAVLEDADAEERATMLGAMPLVARLVWRTLGRVVYALHTRRVRGRQSVLG